MIEKTFGSRISFLIFYFVFISIILFFNLDQKKIGDKFNFYSSLKKDFALSQFDLNLTVSNYIYKDNKTIDVSEEEYTMYLSFEEINDIRIMPIWLQKVFFKKLGVYTNELKFLEKHNLIGKMRFLQIRAIEPEICSNFNLTQDVYSNSSYDKLNICFKEQFETDSEEIKFDCKVLKDMVNSEEEVVKDWNKENKKYTQRRYYLPDSSYCSTNTKEYYTDQLYNPCGNNEKDNNTFICSAFKDGLKSRNLNRYYGNYNKTLNSQIKENFIYSGVMNNYNEDKAYYFDLDYNDFNKTYKKFIDRNRNVSDQNSTRNYFSVKLQEFSRFVFINWVDYNTKLFMISFNCYKTSQEDNDQDKILSVSFYFEFSKTQLFYKNYEILFFKIIKWDKNILNFILYFVFLFAYSAPFFYINILKIYNERLNILYKQFIMFIMNFSLNILILLVLILKVSSVVNSHLNLSPYIQIQFKEYFPIYFYERNEIYIFYLELISLGGIILNIFNSFYFEFFARIFLTFKYMWKYLVAFFTIYFINFFVLAVSFNMLFGCYLEEFKSFPKSFISVMLLEYMHFDRITEMIQISPLITRILIGGLYYLFDFIMINIIFVIFLRSYNKVKRTQPISLLSFNLLLNGLIEFFKNLYLKYFPDLNRLMKESL